MISFLRHFINSAFLIVMISTEKSDTRASGEATPKRIQTDMLNAEQVGQFQLHLINPDQFSCQNPL